VTSTRPTARVNFRHDRCCVLFEGDLVVNLVFIRFGRYLRLLLPFGTRCVGLKWELEIAEQRSSGSGYDRILGFGMRGWHAV
jgi:hypothetical protein